MRRHGLAVGALLATILLGLVAALPVAASVAPPTAADEVAPAAPGVLRAATSGATVPPTEVTVDKPAGTATNDLLLAAISINEVPTVTAPAGWTHLRTETSGSAMRQALYWKVATGSEPASYTWTFSDPVDSAVGAIAAYSGVDTTTPIDVSDGQANASSSSVSAPSITTTVANTLLVGAFGTNKAVTFSAPSGMTERAEVAADGQADVTVELADVAKAATGASGTKVASASSSAVNIGQLVALRPSGTIAFRAASTGETAPVTTITIAKPAGTTTDDVLVAGITVRGLRTITPPAGWTELRVDANGTAITQALFVRTAGASEGADYTFTFDTAISASVGAILSYSGINPSAPVDVHGGQANAQSTTVTAPSITTTSAETVLIGYFGTGNDVTFSAPAGMTERTDILVNAANDVASSSTDTTTHSVPGPTGTKSATTSQSGVNIGQLIALRPADSTNPVAAIAAPAANRALAGDVTITGTATDSQSFKEYTLEYGAGTSPGSWTTIDTSTSQVPATGTLATWSSGSLSGAYTIRLTVTDWGGNSTQATRLVYLDNGRRTNEAYHTRIPFDLGGGYGLNIAVATGEATLDRELFSIPSYGPAQALALHYSSQETSNAGRFGVGWVSNLSQSLTFESGFVVWHAPDGGTVPFGNVAGTWTPLAGHFETLTRGGSEDTITLKDQTTYVFENSGSGRLKRIENRFGTSLTLSWSASSATATDASGRATAIVIDSGNDRITSVTDSAGRAWGFAYTGTGATSELTTITDPAGKTTTLAYDGSHRLTSVTRSRSRVSGSPETITWSVGYTSGKATSVTDPVNAAVANTFTYNASSTVVGLLKAYSPLDRPATTYALDALGRVTTMTGPTALVSSWTYDADSNVLTHGRPVGAGGTATTTSTYDARGNLLTETMPIDGSTTVRTAYSYNATNDMLTMSEADDDSSIRLVTKHTYDGSGHLNRTDFGGGSNSWRMEPWQTVPVPRAAERHSGSTHPS